ncbi:arginine/serine-rich coiled-coil protein 2-like isoform X1 [Bacillus rossius redtenbacheri]|uniref:arginine/serine-rich coiled-coil protein 2-like isoform X1 n=1 Tax=Bacillus rossius redtenbacheri TaxID=93214 RepID=UPI002FDC8890
MSKYSSDSDSSRWSERHKKKKSSGRVRERSRSSSECDSDSDSNYSYKKKYHKHKRGKNHRSRSRDRYTSRRSHRVRIQDERSHSSLRSRSGSRTRSRRSSKSPVRGRCKGRSRSSSQGRGKDRKHKKQTRRRSQERPQRSSSSSSSNGDSCSESPSPSPAPEPGNSPELGGKERTVEELRTKLQRAIKAAQSADSQLRQQGLLNADENRDLVAEVAQRSNTIDEINDLKEFVPKQFTSSRSKPKTAAGLPAAATSVAVDPASLTEAKFSALAMDTSGSIFHASVSRHLFSFAFFMFHSRYDGPFTKIFEMVNACILRT